MDMKNPRLFAPPGPSSTRLGKVVCPTQRGIRVMFPVGGVWFALQPEHVECVFALFPVDSAYGLRRSASVTSLHLHAECLNAAQAVLSLKRLWRPHGASPGQL